MLIRDIFPISEAPRDPRFTCGVEFEIEDIKEVPDEIERNFVVEVDDSLRNNGREFKTKPASYEVTLQKFKVLHKYLKTGKAPFTDRTSIHVHVNVANMDLVQGRELILTYALLEPLFLNFVGPKRQNNIFCVPLNYTHLPTYYRYDLHNMVQKWHKYTAFNILPIQNLGTVEFRHLYGTDSYEVFETWLTALKQLYDYVNERPGFSVIKALQEKNYVELAREIVPVLSQRFTTTQLASMLKDTQLDVKLSVGGLKK